MLADEMDMERQAHERCEEDETASSGSSYVPTTASSDLSEEDQEFDFDPYGTYMNMDMNMVSPTSEDENSST